MALSWSHTVLQAKDMARMLAFYETMLGFEETDAGEIPGGRRIHFMSQQPAEHHQIAFVDTRLDDGPPNSLAHIAFRVDAMAELRALIGRLEAAGLDYRPTSHGNTWSVYFQDPEQNGVEVFCDTPYHVKQPQGQAWDVALPDADLHAWTLRTFKDEPEFGPREAYVARREKELAGD